MSSSNRWSTFIKLIVIIFLAVALQIPKNAGATVAIQSGTTCPESQYSQTVRPRMQALICVDGPLDGNIHSTKIYASGSTTKPKSQARPVTGRTKISTTEIVSTFSSKLGVSINQDDPSRGATFPDVSKKVDFWSAPYITLLIYPDLNSLLADDPSFQKDYKGLNSDRSWESCYNVLAVFPPSFQAKIDSATNSWCANSPAPTAPPPSFVAMYDPPHYVSPNGLSGWMSSGVVAGGNSVVILAAVNNANRSASSDSCTVAIFDASSSAVLGQADFQSGSIAAKSKKSVKVKVLITQLTKKMSVKVFCP